MTETKAEYRVNAISDHIKYWYCQHCGDMLGEEIRGTGSRTGLRMIGGFVVYRVDGVHECSDGAKTQFHFRDGDAIMRAIVERKVKRHN